MITSFEVFINESYKNDMLAILNSARGRFIEAAQKVYNEWDQNEEGEDDFYGAGGICDDIADKICDVINDLGFGSFTHNVQSGNMNHTSAFAYDTDNKILYEIDIHPYNYETGGGYNWKKIPDVIFKPDMVEISEQEYDLYFDEQDEIISESNKTDVLKNTKLGTTIQFQQRDVIKTVYYRGFRNGKHWANFSRELKPFQNDIPLPINKIILIGTTKFEPHKPKDKSQNKKDKIDKATKIDAYKHSKKYPDLS